MDTMTGQRFKDDPLITKEEHIIEIQKDYNNPVGRYVFKTERGKYFPSLSKEEYIDLLLKWYGDKIPAIYRDTICKSELYTSYLIRALNQLYESDEPIVHKFADFLITENSAAEMKSLCQYNYDFTIGFIGATFHTPVLVKFINQNKNKKDDIFKALENLYNKILEHYKEDKYADMRSRQEVAYQKLISDIKEKTS